MESHNLIIGNSKVGTGDMMDKVRKDIAFLNTKILYVEGQRNPNMAVLKTYRAMLESRYSVLEWLQSNHKYAV